jgi:hypothetical protein
LTKTQLQSENDGPALLAYIVSRMMFRRSEQFAEKLSGFQKRRQASRHS